MGLFDKINGNTKKLEKLENLINMMRADYKHGHYIAFHKCVPKPNIINVRDLYKDSVINIGFKSDAEIMEGIEWRYDFKLNKLDEIDILINDGYKYKNILKKIKEDMDIASAICNNIMNDDGGCIDIFAAKQRDESLLNKSDNEIRYLMCEGFAGLINVYLNILECDNTNEWTKYI